MIDGPKMSWETLDRLNAKLEKAEAEIERLRAERDHLAKGLISIALNSCCEGCQEAKKVAMATLDWHTVNEQLPPRTCTWPECDKPMSSDYCRPDCVNGLKR